MKSISIIFLSINALLVLFLPRKLASVPFLLAACYITRGQVIDFGPFSFSVIRVLIAFGCLRIIIKKEKPLVLFNVMDKIIIVWAILAILSSFFHNNSKDALIFRMGLIYDNCGIYFIFRNFCRSVDDLIMVSKEISIILLPVALSMINEKITKTNIFAIFGGIPLHPQERRGKVRAQGPFGHPILAGTVGAICLPLVINLFRNNKKYFIIGIISCSTLVICSASSGPILSSLASLGALILWRFRESIYAVRWAAIIGYIFLDIVMADPAYFILARIDITGGSTGWHRAKLIQNAFKNLRDWWIGGTDYTRHWMPTGVTWSRDHTDITNYFLKMGVWGGLPLMITFVVFIIKAFTFVGQSLKREKDRAKQFTIWALGSSLLSVAATSISVSFFDQSFLFVYLFLAAIASIRVSYEDVT